jgi:hypothetical protein
MEQQVGQRIESWHQLLRSHTWGVTWRHEIGTDRIIADYTIDDEAFFDSLHQREDELLKDGG